MTRLPHHHYQQFRILIPMPQNPRQAKKQTLESAMNEIEKAGQKLIIASEGYDENYPDFQQAFMTVIQFCVELKDTVQRIHDAI